jgi:predicted RNA binding protein YcfA (HicA-like mRNA interferase family)
LTLHDFSCILSGLSKRKKLLEKLMAGNQDKAFSFEEAELLLLHAAFIRDGGEGSHRVYRHADGRKMVLPFHGKDIKPVYIREIRKLLK